MFLNTKEAAGRFGEKNIIRKLGSQTIAQADGLKTAATNIASAEGNVPDVLRPVIAQVTALSSSRAAGAIFDVNKDTANEIRNEAIKKEDKAIVDVRDLAVARVNSCLTFITDEKLQDNGAKTLSEIARNLSSVIRNTTPEKKDEGAGSRFALNILSPVVLGEGWQRGNGLGKQASIEVFDEEKVEKEAREKEQVA